MSKIIVFILISFSCYSQNIFLPDSAELGNKLYLNDYREAEKLQNSPFGKTFSEKFKIWYNFEKQYKAIETINVDEWEMTLYDTKNEQLKFLKENSGDLKAYQINRIENLINYNYWHLIYAYPVIKSNADQKLKNVVSLPTIMTKNFKFDVKKLDSLFECRSFRALLPYYVTYENSKNHNFIKYADMVQSVVDKANFATGQLKGNSLDFVLANLLITNKDRISSSSVRFIASQIENQAVKNQFTGEFLTKIVDREELAKKTKTENDKKQKSKQQGIVSDLEGKAFSFSKYEGKVIYVDFWASWCGPCRAQMPFSKQMHESLTSKEKDKIVFLYISIDEDEEAWKKAIEKLDLKSFEHGISKGGWASEICKKYKIASIPRYMTIDKKGNIVKEEGPRPSDPETILQLRELIK